MHDTMHAKKAEACLSLHQVQLVMDAGWKSSDNNSSWVDVEQL